MNARAWLGLTAAAFALAAVALPVRGADLERATFGSLHSASLETARASALDWLKAAGKTDERSLRAFASIWDRGDRSVLERVAATLALADTEAAQLLRDAGDPARPAPTSVPAILKDAQRPAFFRANLALAYGRALSQRRIYEESLEALRAVKPEDVVDPAAYFFHRAVAEHALLLKKDADRSLVGLMEDVTDAPDRYRMLGMLMHQDMQSWRDKDLGDIARKMDNIERRLELSRGGPKTQKIQKEVVARLDEIIKKLENAANGQCNGGGCPNGGQGRGGQGKPMPDSRIAGNSGPGRVEEKKLRGIMEQWGKLPEKEQAKAMQELIQGMPERHRELIESYFKKLAKTSPNQP